MRFDAPRPPEVGEEEVEYAEQVGDAGADGHQRVHVGRAVLQQAPGVGVEAAAQAEDYGRGEQPHHVVGIGQVHERHADDGHGQGEGDGPHGAPFQRAVLAELFRFLVFRLRGRGCFLFGSQAESHGLYGLLQGCGIAGRRVVGHRGCCCGQVDSGLDHARLPAQGLFHTGGAGGAAHALYIEVLLDGMFVFHC